MKVAMLIPDNRDEFREYDKSEPLFGPAPMALLEGLNQIDNCAIHVISTTHKTLRSPEENLREYLVSLDKSSQAQAGARQLTLVVLQASGESCGK